MLVHVNIENKHAHIQYIHITSPHYIEHNLQSVRVGAIQFFFEEMGRRSLMLRNSTGTVLVTVVVGLYSYSWHTT